MCDWGCHHFKTKLAHLKDEKVHKTINPKFSWLAILVFEDDRILFFGLFYS